MNTTKPEPLLTAKQIAPYFKRDDGSIPHQNTIIRLARQGKIPCLDLGYGLGLRFSPEAIVKAAQEYTVTSKAS